MPVKAGSLGKTYAKFIINKACKNSDFVLTVSEFSKNDIVDFFPKWSAKVRIAHNGVDRSIFKPFPEEQVENFRKRHSLEKKFLLYVGALKDHKNPGALATAVNELDIPLVVLTMDRKDFQQKLLYRIKNKSLVKHIQLDNQDDIALLYNSALILFRPSLYESFGLPELGGLSP